MGPAVGQGWLWGRPWGAAAGCGAGYGAGYGAGLRGDVGGYGAGPWGQPWGSTMGLRGRPWGTATGLRGQLWGRAMGLTIGQGYGASHGAGLWRKGASHGADLGGYGAGRGEGLLGGYGASHGAGLWGQLWGRAMGPATVKGFGAMGPAVGQGYGEMGPATGQGYGASHSERMWGDGAGVGHLCDVEEAGEDAGALGGRGGAQHQQLHPAGDPVGEGDDTLQGRAAGGTAAPGEAAVILQLRARGPRTRACDAAGSGPATCEGVRGRGEPARGRAGEKGTLAGLALGGGGRPGPGPRDGRRPTRASREGVRRRRAWAPGA